MDPTQILPGALALLLAPLLGGIINRVKAVVAGRKGPPLLQAYFDIAKLLRKGAVYSTTTSWVFRAAPTVSLACAVTAALLLPVGPLAAPLGFSGDLLLFVGLLALARFLMVLAALDTGSSFEGMGASRDVFFASLGEPALLLGLTVAARGAVTLSLSGLLGGATVEGVAAAGPALLLVAVALYLVFLAENARVPVDDPNTHLELTMIHEVMALDHSGPDLAYITYASALRMWVLGAVLVELVLPLGGLPWPLALASFVAAMLALAAGTGAVESSTARLPMARVPRLLVGAGGLAAIALILVLA